MALNSVSLGSVRGKQKQDKTCQFSLIFDLLEIYRIFNHSKGHTC